MTNGPATTRWRGRLLVAADPARTVPGVHTPRRRPVRGFTVLEVLATCAVIGALVTVAVVNVGPTAHQVADRAGPLTLATATLDARAAAEANHFTYDETTVPAMAQAAGARTTAAGHVAYTTAPSGAPGPQRLGLTVSVHVMSPAQVAMAVTTSNGPTGPHCSMAVDSLRDGTVFASLDRAVSEQGTNLCTGPVAAACSPSWAGAPGAGTTADPYRLTPDMCQ